MDTFITDVSTTRTNIAIASRTASLRLAPASTGALVPDSTVTAGSPSGSHRPHRDHRHLSPQPPLRPWVALGTPGHIGGHGSPLHDQVTGGPIVRHLRLIPARI